MSDLELREQVAVEVMGLEPVVGRDSVEFYIGLDGRLRAIARGYGNGVVPAYETDIAAAWQVVEKMRERGHRPRMRDCGDKRQWVFYDHNLGHEREHPWAICGGDAEAICRAALAAVRAAK